MAQPFELGLAHKRQATLIYHFMSLDYLQGLLTRIDGLLQYWNDSDIRDYREWVAQSIAARSRHVFKSVNGDNCAHWLGEALGGNPSYRDKHATHHKRFEEITGYARKLGGVVDRAWVCNDLSLWDDWRHYRILFPRLPTFQVRTDIVGRSGEVPPRTGIYVPAHDPHAALQFAWTGESWGGLGDCCTFNDVGLSVLATLGRERMYGDKDALLAFLGGMWKQLPKDEWWSKNAHCENGVVSTGGRLISSDELARDFLFTRKPCDWYLVEPLAGEIEASGAPVPTDTPEPREPYDVCAVTGWWSAPAKPYSRRHFQRGDVLPWIEDVTRADGAQWRWDDDQQSISPTPPRCANSGEPAPRAGLWLQPDNPLVRCRVAENEPLPLIYGPARELAVDRTGPARDANRQRPAMPLSRRMVLRGHSGGPTSVQKRRVDAAGAGARCHLVLRSEHCRATAQTAG